jgi:type II secretory pathway pseudopilin PulG
MIFYMLSTRHTFKGITLLEIIFVIGIIGVIAVAVLGPLSQFRARKTLDASVEVVLAAFSRAHLDTISSLSDQQYGAHLDADQVVYFIGPTYSALEVTNVPYKLSPVIEIGNISLSGGGNDILFQRLTGGTSQSGTFEVRLKSDVTRKVVVTVNGTGAISL